MHAGRQELKINQTTRTVLLSAEVAQLVESARLIGANPMSDEAKKPMNLCTRDIERLERSIDRCPLALRDREVGDSNSPLGKYSYLP